MIIKQYAFFAVPVLFFFAFCCEGWGLSRAKRAKRAGTQNARGTTQPQLPPR